MSWSYVTTIKNICNFFLCCDTNPDKGHLKREGFILSHCWGHIAQHGGKEGIALDHEATDRAAVQSGSTGRSMEVLISFPAPFPPFMQSGHTIHA